MVRLISLDSTMSISAARETADKPISSGSMGYRLYTAKTTLSVIHTHYFMLGMVFFLLLLLLEKSFGFTGAKTGRALAVYHTGLNLTALLLGVRGVVQVRGMELARGLDAAISGIAGSSHILLGVGLILILLQVGRSVAAAETKTNR